MDGWKACTGGRDERDGGKPVALIRLARSPMAGKPFLSGSCASKVLETLGEVTGRERGTRRALNLPPHLHPSALSSPETQQAGRRRKKEQQEKQKQLARMPSEFEDVLTNQPVVIDNVSVARAGQ